MDTKLTIKTMDAVRRFNCKDQSKLKLPESIHLLKIMDDSPFILTKISEQKDRIVAITIIEHDKKFKCFFER